MPFWKRQYRFSLPQDQMEPSVSAHTKAAGIWPTMVNTASRTQAPGVANPSSPASTGAASHRIGNVIMTMTAATAVTRWKPSVVSWTQSWCKCLARNSVSYWVCFLLEPQTLTLMIQDVFLCGHLCVQMRRVTRWIRLIDISFQCLSFPKPFTRAGQQPSLAAMGAASRTAIAVITTTIVGTTATRSGACSETATAPQSSPAAMGGASLSASCATASTTASTMAPQTRETAVSTSYFRKNHLCHSRASLGLL